MSREFEANAKINEIADIGGKYKTVFETPIRSSLISCRGEIIELKNKGLLNKERWLVHIHQDKKGNVKTTPICNNEL